jgi:nicotinamidase/pyrazinamidase
MFYREQFLWSDHCVQGSSGAMIQSRLNTLGADLIIKKGYQAKIDSFSVFFENDKKTSTGLDGSLENALTEMKQAKVNLI